MTIIDSREVFTDGTTTITAHIEPDLDTDAREHLADVVNFDSLGDAYDAALVAGWNADRWHYVGIVVTVRVNGTPVGNASLWAIEHGLLPDQDDPALTVWVDALDGAYGREVTADLVSDALDDASTTLASLATITLPAIDSINVNA